MKWNREQTEKYFVLFGKIMLVAAIVFNAWLTHKCYFNFLLSDDASELVYSRMLAQEGSIISSNWYGSTELEILNTQLIYSLLVPLYIKLSGGQNCGTGDPDTYLSCQLSVLSAWN